MSVSLFLRDTRWERKVRTAVLCMGMCMGFVAHPASAQGVHDTSGNGIAAAQEASSILEDSVQSHQVVQLSPHVLHFDPKMRSATLTFRNTSDSPRQVQVQVQFAYLAYKHGLPGDTIVIDPKGSSEPYDTVIANPGPTDHFAGRWLSGVPTHVTLAPYQTLHVTVRIAPPASLPVGEYWARIVTIVPSTQRKGGTQDERTRYTLPTKLRGPIVQDTCAVFYQKGPLHMGVQLRPGTVARIDAENIGGGSTGNLSHGLWLRLLLHLIGNAPYRGTLHSQFRNLTTGEIVDPNRLGFVLMRDAVVHIAVETDVLAPGSWLYTLTFDNEDTDDTGTDLPLAQRVPMTPVTKSFPFEVKRAW